MHKSIEFPGEMGIRLTGDRSIKYKLDIPDSALMINWKLELLLIFQPPPSTRAAITARRVWRKCKQSHITRFTDIHLPCSLSCLRLSQVGSSAGTRPKNMNSSARQIYNQNSSQYRVLQPH